MPRDFRDDTANIPTDRHTKSPTDTAENNTTHAMLFYAGVNRQQNFKMYFGCIEVGEHEVYGNDVWRKIHGMNSDLQRFIEQAALVQHTRQAQQRYVLSHLTHTHV